MSRPRPRSAIRRRARSSRLALGLALVVAFGSTAASSPASSAASETNLLSAAQATAADSIDGWVAGGNAALTRSVVLGFEDTTSLQVNVTAPDGAGDDPATARTTPVPVTAGHDYDAALRTRPATEATPVRCELAWLDAAGEPVGSSAGEATTQQVEQWVEHRCGGSAPADAAAVTLDVVLLEVSDGDVHHVDGARLVDGGPTAPVEPEPGESDAPAAANLLTSDQHSVEGSTHGWMGQGNTTVAQMQGKAYTGEHSLLVLVDPQGKYADSTRTARVGTSSGNRAVPVTAGHAYKASWRITPHAKASPVRCELRWYNHKGKIMDTIEGPFGLERLGEWTQHVCGGVAPKGAAYASVRVFVDDADYGEVHYVDDAWLVDVGDGGGDSPEPAPQPAATAAPTAEPTSAPVPEPTSEPTSAPVSEPTAEPAPLPEVDDGTWEGLLEAGDKQALRDHLAARVGPVTTALKPSGSITTSQDGQVIEGVLIDGGSITIRHDDVVIRDAVIKVNGWYGINASRNHAMTGAATKGTVIERVRIDARSQWTDSNGTTRHPSAAIHGSGYTLRRSEVVGGADGVKFGTATRIEGNWIHSQVRVSGGHHDAMQTTGGTGMAVVANLIEGPFQASTSAIISGTQDRPIEGYTVERNYLTGGSYSLYLGPRDHPISGVRVVGNITEHGSWLYGPASVKGRDSTWEWSGNRTTEGEDV